MNLEIVSENELRILLDNEIMISHQGQSFRGRLVYRGKRPCDNEEFVPHYSLAGMLGQDLIESRPFSVNELRRHAETQNMTINKRNLIFYNLQGPRYNSVKRVINE